MTRGITEEKLMELAIDPEYEYVAIFKAIKECKELNPWMPIDENTPKNREILVYAQNFPESKRIISACKYHESAGFCIDEFTNSTHWQELPPDPL
jgi:hypothetical protein